MERPAKSGSKTRADRWPVTRLREHRSLLFTLFRILISAGIIVLLVRRLDTGELGTLLKNVRIWPLLLAAAADFAMISANSLRWRILLGARGIVFTVPRLAYYYLVGIFFSTFLPTSVGGDFMRIVGVAGATGRRADAFASVVVERLMGFFVLIPICLVSIPFVAGRLEDVTPILLVGIVGLLIFVGAYLVLLRPVARHVSRLLVPLFRLFGRFKLRERLERAYEAVVFYRDSRQAVFQGLLLSVLSRLLWVLGCYFVAIAFSMDVSFTTLLVVVPVVELARAVPVSLAGIGVREAAFVALLGQFGVGESLAFAYGVMVYVVFLLFSIIGGVLYAVGGLGGRAAADGGRQTV